LPYLEALVSLQPLLAYQTIVFHITSRLSAISLICTAINATGCIIRHIRPESFFCFLKMQAFAVLDFADSNHP